MTDSNQKDNPTTRSRKVITIPQITDSPVEIGYNTETALLCMAFVCETDHRLTGRQLFRYEILMTQESGKRLLADLPKLRMALEMQAEGPIRPNALQ